MSQQYYYNPLFNGQNPEEAQEAARRYFAAQLKAKHEKAQLRRAGVVFGIAIIAYIVAQVAASFVLMRLNVYDLFKNNAVFQYSFSVLGSSVLSVALPFGIVALIFKGEYRHPVVPLARVGFGRAVLWVFFGEGCCLIANVVVNMFINFVEQVFHYKLTQGEMLKPDSVAACVTEIIAIALVPAICEEFAMRCCTLQYLRNYGKGFAVGMVSLIFGILHGNLIQFPFAFMVGIVMAYVTIKTDSIIPAICIHATNNGLSVLTDVLTYTSGSKLANNAVSAVAIALAVLAGISLVVLLVRSEFRRRPDTEQSLLTTGQKVGAFLFPGMIVPFIIMLVITATTVKHV